MAVKKGKKKGSAPSRAALLARIQQLEKQVAAQGGTAAVAGKSNPTASGRGIAARTVKNSLLATGGQIEIKGDVYLGAPTDDSRGALAIYRQVFFSRHQHVFLGGIVPPSADGKARDGRPELAHVYVALDTRSVVETKGGPKRGHAEQVKPKQLSALAAAIRNRHMVLVGEPGSGKSTFVAHLGLCLAAHALSPKAGWLKKIPGWPRAEGSLLPVCVVLRDFARSAALREHTGPAAPTQLWDFLVKQLERQRLDFAAKAIEKSLEKGGVLLILDGLDEIPGHQDVARVRDAVQAFRDRYPRCRMIATCRTASYQTGNARLDDVPDFELARFDDPKIDGFVSAWYAELGRLGIVRAEEEKAKADALRMAVRQKDIGRLVPNPLLLTVVATFHAYKGKLPDQRAQLYEQTIDLLLWTWEQVRTNDPNEATPLRQLLGEAGTNDQALYRALAGRAFLVQAQGGGDLDMAADIAEADLEKDLAAIHPSHSKDWAGKVIQAIRLRAGLLIERSEGVFTFPHRTFQEYLAGAHLAGLLEFATKALELAKSDLALYREVIPLAAGKYVHVNNDVERPLRLIEVLCPADAKDDLESWRLVVLAGEVLVEIGVSTACGRAGGEDLCKRVRGRLLALIEGEKLAARERAIAGDVLATIGDPRFRESNEWCLPADEMFGFVEIPAGPFLMGSDKGRDGDAHDSEMPQHEVDLPGFLMARFPVTVAQFRAFVQATDAKLEDEDGLRSPATRPSTSVSLPEAAAYCAWLDRELRSRRDLPAMLCQGLERGKVTLPSEAEWEKAARGTDGRIYPWGGEWRRERANTIEAELQRTTAVGCFPAGKSPFGCEDMIGEVFEWTRSRCAGYPYPADPKERAKREAPGGDESRVVHGGCFVLGQRYARAAYRFVYHPAARGDLMGFRVVVSPSASDL